MLRGSPATTGVPGQREEDTKPLVAESDASGAAHKSSKRERRREDCLSDASEGRATKKPHTEDDDRSNPIPAGFEYFVLFDDLDYVTPDLPGVGGEIKRTADDFRVTELLPEEDNLTDDPLIIPGESFHWWVRARRKNVTTLDVQKTLATRFGVGDARDVGAAGMKDKVAVATQWFSVPSYSKGKKRDLRRDDFFFHENSPLTWQGETIEVLEVRKRRSKLRRGDHAGNRFEIVLRGCAVDVNDSSDSDDDSLLRRAQRVADRLAVTGVPNYFGPQRFGKGASTALKGANLLLGRKKKRFRARNPMHALAADAFASMLFNVWLSRVVRTGAFATKAADDKSSDWTGPLFGRDSLSSTSLSEDERRVLDESNVPVAKFPTEGGRRAARLCFDKGNRGITITPIDDDASALRFAFDLDNGAYATSVLREFVKRPGFCLRPVSEKKLEDKQPSDNKRTATEETAAEASVDDAAAAADGASCFGSSDEKKGPSPPPPPQPDDDDDEVEDEAC